MNRVSVHGPQVLVDLADCYEQVRNCKTIVHRLTLSCFRTQLSENTMMASTANNENNDNNPWILVSTCCLKLMIMMVLSMILANNDCIIMAMMASRVLGTLRSKTAEA